MTEAQKKLTGLLMELVVETARGGIKWERAKVFLDPRRDFYRAEHEGKIFYYNSTFFLYIFYPGPTAAEFPPLTPEDREKGIVGLEERGSGPILRVGGPSAFWESYFRELKESLLSSWY